MRYLFSAIVVGVLIPLAASAQEASSPTAEEAEIREAGEKYVAAFNQQDAEALAALWSPDAVYTNRTTGEQVVGREAIEEQFVALFEDQSDLRLALSVESIQFVSPNVAVEQGVATFLQAEGEPQEVSYTAVSVRQDGQWLLDRATDEDVSIAPSHFEQLKELEWMIGSWVDADEEAAVITECNWSRNNNFLIRSFEIDIEDRIDMAGIQIIGWDSAAEQIRSWVFDSEGGFGEATWTKDGNRWYIHRSGVLPGGEKSASVSIMTYVDDDTFTLQAINRMVGGELLPNIDEVTVVRE